MGLSIVAVDPGMTTGLAWCPSECLRLKTFDGRVVEMVGLGQISGEVPIQAVKIGNGLKRLDGRICISESSDHFLLAGAGRGKHSLVPVKLNGALSAMCMLAGSMFIEQTPAQAKGVVKDAVLMEMGFMWHKTNERHQIDALRHLVLFIRRYQNGGQFAEAFKEVLG